MNLTSLQNLCIKAATFRESGDIVESTKLFAQIEQELQVLKNSKDSIEQSEYVGMMGHIIINNRHLYRYSQKKTLDQAKEVLAYAQNHGIKAPHLGYALRGVTDVLLDAGAFEEAEKFVRLQLEHMGDDESYKADAKSHLAICLFRQSYVKEALDLINESLQVLKTSTNPNAPVWLSNALMVKSKILRSLNQIPEAKSLAIQALDISTKNNLALRTLQARSLIDLLSNE